MFDAVPSTVPPLWSNPVALESFARFVDTRFGLASIASRTGPLERRLRATLEAAGLTGCDLGTFRAELGRAAPGTPLYRAAADAVPNPKTSFFRDSEQLVALAERVRALRSEGNAEVPLRVLSVGCSTGQEVYSLAMLVARAPLGRPVELWGMDIRPAALAAARAGVFPRAEVERAGEGPEGWVARWFEEDGEQLRARPSLQSRVRFVEGNVLELGPATAGLFDVVLCRNVLIYFSPRHFERAVENLLGVLRPGGVLAVGRAEAGVAAAQGRVFLEPARDGLLRAGAGA